VHFSSHYQAPSTPVSDHSSDSDLEAEDYATDYTSPDTSEMPDDVEEFRDREYPQLKGKTYLDHGGTTVRRLEWPQPEGANTECSYMPNRL